MKIKSWKLYQKNINEKVYCVLCDKKKTLNKKFSDNINHNNHNYNLQVYNITNLINGHMLFKNSLSLNEFIILLETAKIVYPRSVFKIKNILHDNKNYYLSNPSRYVNLKIINIFSSVLIDTKYSMITLSVCWILIILDHYGEEIYKPITSDDRTNMIKLFKGKGL